MQLNKRNLPLFRTSTALGPQNQKNPIDRKSGKTWATQVKSTACCRNSNIEIRNKLRVSKNWEGEAPAELESAQVQSSAGASPSLVDEAKAPDEVDNLCAAI